MAKKILIIEDDRGLARILGEVLTKENFNVSFAVDGKDGLEKALNGSPDLIFLDVQLPRMSGTEFLKKFREERRGAKTPVIVLSNFDDNDTVSKMLEGDVKNFFVKANLNLSEVLVKVRELLRGEA